MSQHRSLSWLWADQLISNSYVLRTKKSGSTSHFKVFCLAGPGTNNQPPTWQAMAYPCTITGSGRRMKNVSNFRFCYVVNRWWRICQLQGFPHYTQTLVGMITCCNALSVETIHHDNETREPPPRCPHRKEGLLSETSDDEYFRELSPKLPVLYPFIWPFLPCSDKDSSI